MTENGLTVSVPPPPRTRVYVLVALAIAVVCLLVFFSLADEIAESDLVVQVDYSLGNALNAVLTPNMVAFYLIISYIGGQGTVVAGLLAAGWALWRRRWTHLAFVFVTLIGAAVLNVALKSLFGRPRPSFANVFAVEQTASFPSGHALLSLVTFGLLTYFVCHRDRRPVVRILVVGMLVLGVLLVGISRIALGVHYLSDVLAGYAAGGLWLSACIAAMSVLEDRRYWRLYPRSVSSA